jgi:hypothetical protein
MQDVLAVQCPNSEEELYEPEGDQFLIKDLSILLASPEEAGQIACLAALHDDDEFVLNPEELLIFHDEGDL